MTAVEWSTLTSASFEKKKINSYLQIAIFQIPCVQHFTFWCLWRCIRQNRLQISGDWTHLYYGCITIFYRIKEDYRGIKMFVMYSK